MTINELLKILRKVPDHDSTVFFDFCECRPSDINAWRGNYSEPALGWIPTGYSRRGAGPIAFTIVRELIDELEEAINGTKFSGLKGGEYWYYGDETLHIDNDGDCTWTYIDSVEVTVHRVTIHTTKNSDI